MSYCAKELEKSVVDLTTTMRLTPLTAQRLLVGLYALLSNIDIVITEQQSL
jgi:hypothetical protein